MGLEVTVIEKENSVFMVTPRGEINTETYKTLEEKVKDAVTKAKAVILEMGQVS